MGMFDTVKKVPEPYDNQFKLWDCSLQAYGLGDLVPKVGGHSTYSVRLNCFVPADPCYLLVKDDKIVALASSKPLEGCPIFSKWGGDEGEE